MQPAVDPGRDLPSRYRVLGPLGRGAFAEALRCEDAESGAEVVVKLYELRGGSWSLLTSFEREAEVLAQLDHPAIPRYLHHGQLPDGRLMLVQSFARGRSLADLLREGRRFTDEEIRGFAEQVLDVLQYLQSFNPPIIHRDIKPANLVLGDDGRLRLVDFGSVKASFRTESELGSTIVGTYGYMAPEQFQGRATIQSDLYALGATLIHLLSHVPPSELPQDGLRLDFRGHIKASPGTTAWLERLLEPDPRLRFATAAQALSAFRGRDVRARAAGTGLARLEPPQGSRIQVAERGGELELTVPGSGVRSGLRLLGGAGATLAFVLFWTGAAGRVSVLFALFSIPFWLAGVSSLIHVLWLIAGRITIRLGPQTYSITKQLFWYVRHVSGPTSDLGGASFEGSGDDSNDKELGACVLHAGAEEVKFGAQLGLVERRFIVSRINRHLGLPAHDDGGRD